jgi:hypothetical protein
MSQDQQDRAGVDTLGLFQMVAPERSSELEDLISRYTPSFFLASDQWERSSFRTIPGSPIPF